MTMTRLSPKRLALLPALLAFAALTGSAAAQVTAAQQGAIRSNCRSDFMSKCSGVTPGGKDALACLQKNVGTLSPACKTAVSATLPPPAPAAAAPAPVKPVQAAPAAAPAPAPATAAAPPPPPPAAAKTAVPVVSAPPPRAKVAAPPRRAPAAAAVAAPAPVAPAAVAAPTGPTAAQQSAMRSSCRNDFMAKCSGVQPGGKDALGCLQKNVATLSAACKKVVSSTMSAPPAGAAAPTAVAPAAVAAPPPKAGFVPGSAVISKACARYILMHCRGMGLDMSRKIACLTDYANSGNFVGPRCRAALKITERLR